MRRAGRQNALLLVSTCLLLSGVLGSSRSAPLTIWASSPLFDSKAHFESLPASEILADLVALAAGATRVTGSPLAGLLGQGPLEDARPRAVVVFVSAQQDGSAAAGQLRVLTSAAGSWVQLPNAVHQGQSSAVFKGLQHMGDRASLQVFGSCTGAPAVVPATPEGLRQHLKLGQLGQGRGGGGAGEAGPAVVVICAEGGAEEEAALLAEAQAAVAAASDKFVLVHTTTTGGLGGAEALQRRRLQQAEDTALYKSKSSKSKTKYTTCDAKCRIQVKYLEGFIVFVTVALAVAIGFCCMHIINTPTRFETPKELRSGGHHE